MMSYERLKERHRAERLASWLRAWGERGEGGDVAMCRMGYIDD